MEARRHVLPLARPGGRGRTRAARVRAPFWRGEGEPQPDALAVVDVDVASPRYGQVVGWCAMPNTGDELHHHGWNACSSALCPNNAHPHVERRYLLMMGLRSSRKDRQGHRAG